MVYVYYVWIELLNKKIKMKKMMRNIGIYFFVLDKIEFFILDVLIIVFFKFVVFFKGNLSFSFFIDE